jgi:hypothetical protein
MADDNSLIEISLPTIQGMEEILKPSDRPVIGQQRLVRFLPVPGTEKLFPCIWMSPYHMYEHLENGEPLEQLVRCVVLISKGPPKPDVVIISIRPDDLEKFPRAPVEW